MFATAGNFGVFFFRLLKFFPTPNTPSINTVIDTRMQAFPSTPFRSRIRNKSENLCARVVSDNTGRTVEMLAEPVKSLRSEENNNVLFQGKNTDPFRNIWKRLSPGPLNHPPWHSFFFQYFPTTIPRNSIFKQFLFPITRVDKADYWSNDLKENRSCTINV